MSSSVIPKNLIAEMTRGLSGAERSVPCKRGNRGTLRTELIFIMSSVSACMYLIKTPRGFDSFHDVGRRWNRKCARNPNSGTLRLGENPHLIVSALYHTRLHNYRHNPGGYTLFVR